MWPKRIHKRRRPTSANRRSLGIEQLESRRLLAGTIFMTSTKEVLATNVFSDSEISTTGDFNHDGSVDVVRAVFDTVQPSASISLFLGTTAGSFVPAGQRTINFRPDQILAGDYDGNGNLDLIATYSSGGVTKATILPGLGNGQLAAPLSTIYNPGRVFTIDSFSDFNGDGRADLVTAGLNFTASRGNGNGTFTPVFTEAPQLEIRAPLLVDVDKNSRLDLVYSIKNADQSSNLIIRKQNANGTFAATATSYFIDGSIQDIAAGDFNEDGNIDFIESHLLRVPIHLPDGVGIITHSVKTLITDGTGNVINSQELLNSSGEQLLVGDLDLDKHLDVAMLDFGSNTFLIYRGKGDGTLRAPSDPTFAAGDIKNLIANDFNRDGKIDLIATVIEPESAGHKNSSVSLFLNQADRANAIRGRLWNDLNKNQVFDLNESPIGGRYVWPDQDDNGVITFETDPQGVFTDADGTYELFVPNGTSIIRQLLPAGWVQTDRFSSPGVKPTAYHISISGLAVTSGWDFGSYFLGTVSGRVFNDYNANLTFDQVESGLAGWRVFSDTNGNSTYEVGEPTSLTTSDGTYGLNLSPGSYTIRQIPPVDWYVTNVASYSVVVVDNEAVYNRDFGRTRLGGVAGRVYYDALQNGYGYDGDAGIAGVQVYLDLNNNGAYNAPVAGVGGEPMTVSNASGDYQISNVFPRAVKVQIVKPTGHEFTQPVSIAGADAFYDGYVYGGFPGANTDFGLINPAFVSGRVFNDISADGIVQGGENGLPTVFVAIDYNGDGIWLPGEPSAWTDANGNYLLRSARGGAQTVLSYLPSGYNATLPSSSSIDVNLVQGQTLLNQNFGIKNGPFSNAPYLPPVNIPTGDNPVAIAAGDFNRDGKPDFVVASNASPGQVFLGQGNGTFTAGTSFFIGSSTRYMIAIDLNKDAKLDLVAANQDDNGVSVLLGIGDGTFAEAVNYAAVVSTYGVAVADFNNDGDLDIVAAGPFDTHFALLTGTGVGTFNPAVLFDTEFGGVSIAAGETNADGKLDVVIANRDDSSISIHRGNGSGTFAPRIRTTSGIVQPTFVTLADVNTDGRLDLVYLNEPSNRVGVRLANGTGGFAGAKLFATTASPQQVAVIDVDRDGKLDLVVAGRSDGGTNISGGVSILRGNGDGTFQSHRVATAHTSPTAIAIADFNGDTKLDIVALNFFSADASLLTNGTPGRLGGIAGFAFNDQNLNGIKNVADGGLANQTIFADINSNGVLDPGERSTTTSGDGAYLLSDLPAGSYRIKATSTPAFIPTRPKNQVSFLVTVGEGQTVTADDIGLAPTQKSGGFEYDNNSATLTGAWAVNSTVTGFLGNNYLTDLNTGKGTKSVRYTAMLPQDGYYEVLARWTSGSDRATNVPVDVVSDSDSRQVTVNQSINGGKWVSLGVYPFKRDIAGVVIIRNSQTNGLVVADGVRFVPAPDPFTVIRDNPNATVTGAWTTLTTPATQRYNANYLSDENPAVKGNHSVTYKSGALAASGIYEIFGWWTASSLNASNVLYTLTTGATTSTVRANQKLNGGQWVSLGYFDLATTGATLTLSNHDADGRVIADAVRFVRVM